MRRALPAIVLLAGVLCGADPVRVILDTDLGPDCDDAGAIAMLHTMERRGEARALGIMCNTTSEWCAPAVDSIDTYYGRADVPVGTLKGAGNPGGSDSWNGTSFNRYLAGHFPNRLKNGRNAPDAVKLYRKLLAAQADGSVAVVSIGNTTNLRDLLVSKADDASPLDGTELVRRKVRVLSVMGGRYPRGKESNLDGDIPATKMVLDRWPTPITFSGFEVGDRVYTGQGLWDNTPESNPVRMAYWLWDKEFRHRWERNYDGGRIRPHPSYDQTALLYAVRGLRDYWTARTGGVNRFFDDGANEWVAAPDHGHGYLIVHMPPERLAAIIEEMMVAAPAKAKAAAAAR